MEELISVIIPVYNVKNYLVSCVESILAQTYNDLEILLVDDGSTDGSGELCDELSSRDDRILVIHKENSGVAGARNEGLKAMKGVWFLTMDSDDYIAPAMVETMHLAALNQRADLVICGFTMVFEQGTPKEVHCGDHDFHGSRQEFVNRHMTEYYDKLLLNNQNNKLYLAEIVRVNGIAYDESMSINEDAWFSVTMLRHSRRVSCIARPFLYYRQYDVPASLVTRFNKNGVDTCFVLLKALEACMDSVKTGPRVRQQMYNRMIFHICGFAGLMYYRSGYSANTCLYEIRRLAARDDFQTLLMHTKPQGGKNQVAAALLRHRLCGFYHLLCLAVYHGKRNKWKAGNKEIS